MKNYFKPLLEERTAPIFAEKIANGDGLIVSVVEGFFVGEKTGEEDVW